jgi:hypothetical protein
LKQVLFFFFFGIITGCISQSFSEILLKVSSSAIPQILFIKLLYFAGSVGRQRDVSKILDFVKGCNNFANAVFSPGRATATANRSHPFVNSSDVH